MANTKLTQDQLRRVTGAGVAGVQQAATATQKPASQAQTTTTKPASQTQTGSGLGQVITGAGALGGVAALTGQGTQQGGGSKSSGGSQGGYYVQPQKPTNPYDNPTELQGGENPYAKLAGQGGENPYAKLQGQGGENPYAGVDQTGYTQSPVVQQAQEYLQQLRQQAPGEYKDPYQDQLSQLYQDIVGRGKFSYDLDGDMLYKQYKQQYQQMGQQAMRDTMGQAAALTGGYGSSYASTAGNQAYQAYLQQLNDKIPELYDRALAAYQLEGDQLKDQYGMLRDLQDTDYGRYQDALSRYYQDLGLAREDWRDLRDFDYGQWGDQRQYDLGLLDRRTSWDQQQRDYDLGLLDRRTSWDQQQWDREFDVLQAQTGWDQQQRQEAQQYAMAMLQAGLDPSEALRRASGMSDYDYWQWLQKYKPQQTGYYVQPTTTTTTQKSTTQTAKPATTQTAQQATAQAQQQISPTVLPQLTTPTAIGGQMGAGMTQLQQQQYMEQLRKLLQQRQGVAAQ